MRVKATFPDGKVRHASAELLFSSPMGWILRFDDEPENTYGFEPRVGIVDKSFENDQLGVAVLEPSDDPHHPCYETPIQHWLAGEEMKELDELFVRFDDDDGEEVQQQFGAKLYAIYGADLRAKGRLYNDVVAELHRRKKKRKAGHVKPN